MMMEYLVVAVVSIFLIGLALVAKDMITHSNMKV